MNRPDNGVLGSQYSQSFTQWIDLSNPDHARTILPPGQSEHPDSPCRTVNLHAWKIGELHPAPITRRCVEKYVKTN